MSLNTDAKQYELTEYLLSIDKQFDMVAAYNKMIEDYESINHNLVELSYILHSLGCFLMLTAKYVGAEPLLCRALAIRKKVLGSSHPETANSLDALAGLLFYRYGMNEHRQMNMGEGLLHHKLIKEKLIGRELEHKKLKLLNGKDNCLKVLDLYLRALTIREKVLGPEHPATATSLHNIAEFLLSLDAFSTEGESFLRRALSIREKVLGPDHPDTAASLNVLAGGSLSYKSRIAEYEPLLRRALSSSERVYGPDHPFTAKVIDSLAALLHRKGKYLEAEALFQKTLAIKERFLGYSHPEIHESVAGIVK